MYPKRKSRPTLFNGHSVRSILRDEKSKTRRILKPNSWVTEHGMEVVEAHMSFGVAKLAVYDGAEFIGYDEVNCPYGVAGDTLWVRETWAVAECYNEMSPAQLPLTARNVNYQADDEKSHIATLGRWRSPFHMPRWASRITLRVVDIQVGKLQDISEADAVAEGYQAHRAHREIALLSYRKYAATARDNFMYAWDNINGHKKGGKWTDNPLVWTIEFEQIKEA